MNINFKFLIIFLLTFKVVTAVGVFDFLYKLSSTDQAYMLSAVNGKRSLHETTRPVKWSDTLASAAVTKLTNDFTCKGGISLSNDAYGYTYYFGTEGVGAAVESWYNGESSYNYDNPEINTANRDFIQLVWAQSTEIGCASRLCGTSTAYLCQYYQPGVYRDILSWNVFPPIDSSKTETSVATITLVQTDIATGTVTSINTETHVVTNTDITTETQVTIQFQTETQNLTNTETLTSTEIQTQTERLTNTDTVTHISVITDHHTNNQTVTYTQLHTKLSNATDIKYHTITDTVTVLSTVPTVVTQNLTVMQTETETETVTHNLIATEVVTHYYNTTDVSYESFTVTKDVTFLTTETVTLINSENNVITITEIKNVNFTNPAITINPINVTISETVTVTNNMTKTDTITSLGNYSYPEAITVTVTSIPDNVQNMTITVISTEVPVHNVTSTETITKTKGELITSFVTIVETNNVVSEATTTISITVKETVSLYITPSQLSSAHETVTMAITSTETIRETVTVSNSFPSESTSQTSSMTITSESSTKSSSLSVSAVITNNSKGSDTVSASSNIQLTSFSHSLLSSTLSSGDSKVIMSVDAESKIKASTKAIEHNAIDTHSYSTIISESNNNYSNSIESTRISLGLSHTIISDSNSLASKDYRETSTSSEEMTEMFFGTSISASSSAKQTDHVSINVNGNHETSSSTTLGQNSEEDSLSSSQNQGQNLTDQVSSIQSVSTDGSTGSNFMNLGTSTGNFIDQTSISTGIFKGTGQDISAVGSTTEILTTQSSIDQYTFSESSATQGTSTEVTPTLISHFASSVTSTIQGTSIEGTSTVADQDISTRGSISQDHERLSSSQPNISNLEQNENYPDTGQYENTLDSNGNSLGKDQFHNEATQSSGFKGGKSTMFSSYEQAHTAITSTLTKASNSGITNSTEAAPNMTENTNGNTVSDAYYSGKEKYLSHETGNNRFHKENRVSLSDQLDHISLSSSVSRETLSSVDFTTHATVSDDSTSSMDVSSHSVVISGTSVIPRETGNWNTRSSIEHRISDILEESSSLNTISHSTTLPSTVQIPTSDANRDTSVGLTFSNSATSIHLKTWKDMLPVLFFIFYLL
ncbi:hypothetical protein C6P45_003356 [Maudiozyma exigua]|uniref:SCP domain-containing protein n=1 Tax=Maudiozyma exigua TaxID=34358 RepID=A0A9P6VTK8_MAUEX|nr:hypothetical protein C6P45_003356 [Kazachstania exigua]